MQEEAKKLWDGVLIEMELAVSKANFTTWFKNTSILKIENGVVSLSVPNEFVKEWLLTKYHKTILKILRNLNENIRSVEYAVSKEEIKKKEASIAKQMVPETPILPLEECYVDKESNLNPRYTFENFVVGPFNELAYAAASAVIKNPGRVYNPLYIYGNTGRGKTHLIQAIGNELRSHNRNLKIIYVTSEKFTIDYTNSVQANKINSFKERYRKYDILIMDDIQFLSTKEKTQEELFHLFNIMHDGNKQIIFSSDKHPNFMPNLEDRLKSRFSAGMILDIPAPDSESRAAILKAKAGANNFNLPWEITSYLSENIDGNIRELEGILNLIICQTQVKGKDLSLQEVKNIIKNNEKPKKAISIKDIIKVVADFYSLEEGVIYEKTRRKEVVKPRQLTMYLLREDYNISYPLIGQKLGGRDHTTVMHSCEKIKNELKENSILLQELNQIRALI